MNNTVKILMNKRWQAYRNKNFAVYKYYQTKVREQIIKVKHSWADKVSRNKK